MTPLQDRIVTEALTWVGTPFHHNQSVRGIGADCIGVVGGIALACGIKLDDMPHAYPKTPNGTLKPWLDSHLITVGGWPQPGDVLLMSFEGDPHHVAMAINFALIIHSYAAVRRCLVQEYDTHWQQKTKCMYRFRELA